jgi:type II secretory pathway component GspD/PulD (secretin)
LLVSSHKDEEEKMRKILLSFVILIGLLYSQEVPFNIPQGKVDDIKEIFEKGFGYKVADKSLGIKDRFDLVAPRALNFQQAFHFVNTRLQEKGYTFILDRKWKVIEIWEISRVDRSKLESFFLPDINTLKDRIDKGTLFESEIVQATIKSEKIDAGSLARELSRELKFPEWVIIEPDMTANVVKTVSTVAQLMKMLEQKEPIEKTIGKEIEGKLVRVFQVKNIKALAAFQILVDLLHLEIITPVEPKEEKQQPGGTQPGGTQPGEAPTRPRGEGGGGGRPSFPFDISSLIKKGGKAGTVIEGGGLGPVAKGTIKEKDDIFVYVDQETNSLIVVAKREHVEKVEQLLRLIDFEPPSKAVPALPHYEVYPLKYARAREAVQILTSSFMSYYGVVLGGAVVTTLNAGFEIEMVKPKAETGSYYTPSVSASGVAPSGEKVRKIEPPDEKTYSLARGIIPGKIAFIAEDRSNSIIIFATGAEIECMQKK